MKKVVTETLAIQPTFTRCHHPKTGQILAAVNCLKSLKSSKNLPTLIISGMIESRKNLQHTVCVQVSCMSTIKLSAYNT